MRPVRRRRFRPAIDRCEDRLLLSTLIVTSAADHGSGSLRDTIAAAANGDTITFAKTLNGRVITLSTGELTIGKSLDIEGPGAGKLTISAGGNGRAFLLTAGSTEIDGLTITGGLVTAPDQGLAFAAGGAVLVDGGSASFSKDTLIGNSVRNSTGLAAGGALAAVGSGTALSLSGSTVSGDGATGQFAEGGGLANLNGASVTITGGSFAGDVALGGGYALGGGIADDGAATLNLNKTSFTDDLAQGTLAPTLTGPSYMGGGRRRDRQRRGEHSHDLGGNVR